MNVLRGRLEIQVEGVSEKFAWLVCKHVKSNAIALAKGEIVEALPEDGIAVLNADDPLVAAMASRTSARTLTYGESAGSDVRLSGLELDDLGRPRFDLVTDDGSAHVELMLLGEHQAHNAACALAAAQTSGGRGRDAGPRGQVGHHQHALVDGAVPHVLDA